jgi:ribosome maturation factor RimP
MSSETTLERVRRMVAPVVADLHLDLYDIELRGGTLRITVDTPPGSAGGVDLDTLTLVTKMLSRDLDHDDPMPGHYTLEVTSPGLERTLRTPAHYQREVGKTVALRLRDVVQGERRVQGVLVAADDQGATIRTDDLTDRVVAYDQIDRARTVFVWGPAPKPGKSPGKPKAAPKARAASAETGDAGAATEHTPQEAQ